MLIELIKGDITTIKADAVVNAANSTLLGGGGVDGAIHEAAGSELLKECKTIGGCPTGEARITGGYNLPAKYVIHTVGPIWRGGIANEHELLTSAYSNSLKIALDYKIEQIAFPNISTGVYGFPKESAARIAIRTVTRFLEKNTYPKKVVFVCFDEDNYSIYSEMLKG
jgi:O-acetyl-ADP-ribose deacetylase (regulator of RNase III)